MVVTHYAWNAEVPSMHWKWNKHVFKRQAALVANRSCTFWSESQSVSHLYVVMMLSRVSELYADSFLVAEKLSKAFLLSNLGFNLQSNDWGRLQLCRWSPLTCPPWNLDEPLSAEAWNAQYNYSNSGLFPHPPLPSELVNQVSLKGSSEANNRQLSWQLIKCLSGKPSQAAQWSAQ